MLKTTTSCPLEYGGPRSALPGTAAEIAEFEQRAGWQLDPDLRAFYLHCNGAELIKRGPDCPYRILPLSRIVRARVAIFGRDEDKHGPASVYAICDVQDGDYIVHRC